MSKSGLADFLLQPLQLCHCLTRAYLASTVYTMLDSFKRLQKPANENLRCKLPRVSRYRDYAHVVIYIDQGHIVVVQNCADANRI